MPKVRAEPLPAASALWALHRPGDFIDGYAVTSRLTPQDGAARGLALPGWARALLALRNALVRPFGLRTGTDGPLFPVVADTPSEYIIGLDDRHLNFRIAVLRQGDCLHMATWVRPHNIWGRAYLRAVMPFHILISRGAVARMAG
jgi:hypothetical protein